MFIVLWPWPHFCQVELTSKWHKIHLCVFNTLLWIYAQLTVPTRITFQGTNLYWKKQGHGFPLSVFLRSLVKPPLTQGVYLHLPRGVGEVGHQWRAIPEDPSLVPITHIRRPTITCNSSSRGSITFFWPPQVITHMWHTFTQNTHINKNKSLKPFKKETS